MFADKLFETKSVNVCEMQRAGARAQGAGEQDAHKPAACACLTLRATLYAAVAAATLALMLALCAFVLPAYAESSSPSPLHVSGTRLVDASGEVVQLRGVSTHGLAWYPDYVNADAFRTLRDDWGANVVRLALYTNEYGGYCNGGDRSALEALIDKGVSAATELGMYVIIDWHVLNDWSGGSFDFHESDAVDFFSRMSAKYAGQGNVIYEICNEPQSSPFASTIRPYAERVLAAIRANDADAVVIVGTNTWSQDVDDVAANRLDDANVVYALHFYAGTHKDQIRAKLESALAAGVPVFVSECSITDASGSGAIDYESAAAWIDLLNANDISYVAWSLCNKAETSALISSSCTKTSGWAESELSEAGKWWRSTILEGADRRFSDVVPGAWYEESVEYMADAGLITGYGGTRLFGVGDVLTRAQAALILYRQSGASGYSDVNETGMADVSETWYIPAVNWAVEQGIFTGYDNGFFGSDDPLTTEQLVTVLARRAGVVSEDDASVDANASAGVGVGENASAGVSEDASISAGGDAAENEGEGTGDSAVLARYADANSVSPWARSAMAWAIDAGIVGVNTDYLNPAGSITRERAATILARTITQGLLPSS